MDVIYKRSTVTFHLLSHQYFQICRVFPLYSATSPLKLNMTKCVLLSYTALPRPGKTVFVSQQLYFNLPFYYLRLQLP